MTKEKVGESFGLIADPSSKLNQEAAVRAVRATGEVFDLLLTITKVTHNIITASLRDATAPDAIQPPHTVSSASASYQDSLSSYQSTLSHRMGWHWPVCRGKGGDLGSGSGCSV